MIISKKYSSVVILLVFIVACTTVTFAQRKKKTSESPIASVKLREAEFYFTEGEKYFILEDYAKALIYYQKALEINPGSATVHYKIAEVLSSSEKHEDLVKATVSIEQALGLERKK